MRRAGYCFVSLLSLSCWMYQHLLEGKGGNSLSTQEQETHKTYEKQLHAFSFHSSVFTGPGLESEWFYASEEDDNQDELQWHVWEAETQCL